jgi:tetratricopeptide (TPR) repeat protein
MRARLSMTFAVLAASALAHEGPEHEIEELTARMKANGETAELLTERAVEYRVLGKLAEAAKDLERAVGLDPTSLPARRELARVLFLDGKADDALAEVARALRLEAEEPADVASVRMLRAEILRSKNEHKKAVEDCDAALRLHRENPEWYLLRSDIQRRLKAHKERLAGIEDGIAATGAGVLEIERVEAMIDAGQPDAALLVIARELEESRIKSSWLIRRARAQLALGKKAAAETDLKDALEEIAQRLNPKTPDAQLLLDKALAHELLGEKKDALRSYEEARDKGADGLSDKIKSLQDPTPAEGKRDAAKEKK